MAIIVTRSKTTADDVNPALPLKWLAEQSNGGRIALADGAMFVQYNHARRQSVQQGRKPVRQLFFLLQLLLTLS